MELDLTRGGVFGRLARFALPLFFANLLQSLYHIVDMLVVGRFLGSPGLAAVSSASTICYIITSICTGVTTGGSVLVAQYKGAGDRVAQRETVGTLFSLSGIIALVITAVSLLSYGPILRLMQLPADALPHALDYMLVISCGTLFVLGYNAVCAVLRGLGDAKSPLLFVAIATAVNVVLDLLLVGTLALGTTGAALATVSSQGVSFLVALVLLHHRGFFKGVHRRDFIPQPQKCRSILRIGLPSAVQWSVVNLSYLLVTGLFNGLGTAIAAAAGVGLKINTFAAMPCWAVGQAVTTMAGQSMGAGDTHRAGDTARAGLVMGMLASAVTAALVFFWAGPMVAFFDEEPAVVAAGITYLRICCSVNCVVYAAMYVLDSFAVGVGCPSFAMVNALLHSVVMRLSLSWLLGITLRGGFLGLCWAEMLAPLPCALLGAAFFCLGRWKTKHMI